MRYKRELIGETLGTFVLVLFRRGKAAFPDHIGGFFWVYILSPIAGGSLASLFFVHVLEPVMKHASNGILKNK